MFVKFWDDYIYLINLDQVAEVRLDLYNKEIVFETMEQFKSEYKSEFGGTPDGDMYFNWHYQFCSFWQDEGKVLEIVEDVMEKVFDQLCAAIARKDALFDLEKATIDCVTKYGVPIDE